VTWVGPVTWMLAAVAAGVLVLAALISAGRIPARLDAPYPRRHRHAVVPGGIRFPHGEGPDIEWAEQCAGSAGAGDSAPASEAGPPTQIREHAHGRHEAQDR